MDLVEFNEKEREEQKTIEAIESSISSVHEKIYSELNNTLNNTSLEEQEINMLLTEQEKRIKDKENKLKENLQTLQLIIKFKSLIKKLKNK